MTTSSSSFQCIVYDAITGDESGHSPDNVTHEFEDYQATHECEDYQDNSIASSHNEENQDNSTMHNKGLRIIGIKWMVCMYVYIIT